MYLLKTLLLWFALIFSVYNVGKIFLSRKFSLMPLERFVISAGLGFGLLSLLMLLLGAIGLLYSSILMILSIVLLFLAALVFFKDRKEQKALASPLPTLNAVHPPPIIAALRVLLMVCAFYTCVALIAAVLNPGLRIDSYLYHITSPKAYLSHHRILPLPYNLHSNWHYFTEMLYLWGLSLYPDNFMLCKLIAVGFTILMAMGIYSCGRRFFSVDVGLFGVVFFLFMHEVREYAPSAYVDFVMGFYTFMGFYILALWAVESPSRRMMALASVMFGFAISAKNHGPVFFLIGIGALFLYLLIYPLINRTGVDAAKQSSLRPFLSQLLYLIVPAAVISSGWYIKNLAVTGNPLFPFFVDLFPTKQEYYLMGKDFIVQFTGLQKSIPFFEALGNCIDYIALYFHNVVYIDLNKLFLISLIGILLVVWNRLYSNRALTCFMIFSIISLPILVYTPRWRYILGFFGVPIIFFFASIWTLSSKTRKTVFYVSAMVAVCVLGYRIFSETVYGDGVSKGMYRFGWKVYVTEHDIRDFYEKSQNDSGWEDYTLVEYINTHLGSEHTLLVTENSIILPLINVRFLPNMHMHSSDIFDLMVEKQRFSSDDIVAYLKERAITHLLTSNTFKGDELSGFRTSHLVPVKIEGGLTLYELY